MRERFFSQWAFSIEPWKAIRRRTSRPLPASYYRSPQIYRAKLESCWIWSLDQASDWSSGCCRDEPRWRKICAGHHRNRASHSDSNGPSWACCNSCSVFGRRIGQFCRALWPLTGTSCAQCALCGTRTRPLYLPKCRIAQDAAFAADRRSRIRRWFAKCHL